MQDFIRQDWNEQADAGYGKSFKSNIDGVLGKRQAMNIRVAEFKCNNNSFSGAFYRETHFVVCCGVVVAVVVVVVIVCMCVKQASKQASKCKHKKYVCQPHTALQVSK